MEDKDLSVIKEKEETVMEDKELLECMERFHVCEHAPGIVYGESLDDEEITETGVIIVWLFVTLGIIALCAFTYFIFYF